MKIGSASAARGELATGHVVLGEYPDGAIQSPVMIARGRGDGPVLWLQCLVHGPEVGGPIAVARFLRSIDLNALKGTIVAQLAANPLGLRAYNRLTPQDGMNLNRVFPGKPDGSVSEQIAHRVITLAAAHGDVLVDLHSGGDLTITAFYAIWAMGDSAASRESQRLVAATGSRYQWGSDESWLKGALFGNFTRRFDKPALIVESGGGGRVTDSDLANYRSALDGVTRALGMLPGSSPVAQDIRYGGGAFHVKATRGGFWHPEVAPGDDMAGDQVMGRIVDVFGEVVEIVRCPTPRAWVGSIRRPFMGVYSGDQVVEVVVRGG
jgi:predicted deacylase